MHMWPHMIQLNIHHTIICHIKNICMSIANLFRLGRLWIEHFGQLIDLYILSLCTVYMYMYAYIYSTVHILQLHVLHVMYVHSTFETLGLSMELHVYV